MNNSLVKHNVTRIRPDWPIQPQTEQQFSPITGNKPLPYSRIGQDPVKPLIFTFGPGTWIGSKPSLSFFFCTIKKLHYVVKFFKSLTSTYFKVLFWSPTKWATQLLCYMFACKLYLFIIHLNFPPYLFNRFINWLHINNSK